MIDPDATYCFRFSVHSCFSGKGKRCCSFSILCRSEIIQIHLILLRQIKFGITEAANIDLRIYDVLGKEVAVLISNQFMSAGSYNVKFDASKLASGNYVYRMTAGANTVSKKDAVT